MERPYEIGISLIATCIGIAVVRGVAITLKATAAKQNAMAVRARTHRDAALALAARNTTLRARAESLIETHAAALRIARERLDDSQWLQAVEAFIDEIIEASGCQIRNSPPLLRAVRERMDLVTARRGTATPARDGTKADGTPLADGTPMAYEQAVADGLRALGWRTRLTGPGEDRHFDVIAQLRDQRVMIQCPGFVSPIRAGVIQELDDAKTRAGAHQVAIVSNAEFTPAARDLATLTGMIVLRHDDLARLACMVSRSGGAEHEHRGHISDGRGSGARHRAAARKDPPQS